MLTFTKLHYFVYQRNCNFDNLDNFKNLNCILYYVLSVISYSLCDFKFYIPLLIIMTSYHKVSLVCVDYCRIRWCY